MTVYFTAITVFCDKLMPHIIWFSFIYSLERIKSKMQIKNTPQNYGLVAKFFHWLMALLIIGIVSVGLYMTDLPIGTLKLKLYGLHKEFGLLVLMLVMLRIVWRIGNIAPLLPASMPGWQKLAANSVHWAFYGFMFAMPLSGWAMSSAAGFPPSFFGLFVLPGLIAPDQEKMVLLKTIHQYLAYGLIAAFCAHVAAALQHHFIDKDNTLRKML
jgi:cytochrome b561